MKRTFGVKEDVPYVNRKGAYLIPIDENKIAVVQTEKGYFLLGGGIEYGETDEECIRRECLEEVGYTACIQEYICSAESYLVHPEIGHFHPMGNYYSGLLLEQVRPPMEKDHRLVWIEYENVKNNLYVSMQEWALEECWKRRKQHASA